MVIYKPNIECRGIRGIGARVRGIATRYHLVRYALIALPVLAVLGVIGNFTSGYLQEIRYCRHCGLLEYREETSVFGVTCGTSLTFTDSSYISRWLAGRGVVCAGHDFRTAARRLRQAIGQSVRGDENPISGEMMSSWIGWPIPGGPEDYYAAEGVLDNLAKADAAEADRLVRELLGENGGEYWKWFDNEGDMYMKYGDDPA